MHAGAKPISITDLHARQQTEPATAAWLRIRLAASCAKHAGLVEIESWNWRGWIANKFFAAGFAAGLPRDEWFGNLSWSSEHRLFENEWHRG
jgi:hypothetical protein